MHKKGSYYGRVSISKSLGFLLNSMAKQKIDYAIKKI